MTFHIYRVAVLSNIEFNFCFVSNGNKVFKIGVVQSDSSLFNFSTRKETNIHIIKHETHAISINSYYL